MEKQKMTVVLIACLTLAVFTGASPSGRPRPRLNLPDPQSMRGLTGPEKGELMRKSVADWMLQERISSYEYGMARIRQALMNELRVSEAQWRIIEPKYERQIQLMFDARRRANFTSRNGKPPWTKPTEDGLTPLPKTEAQLTEAERCVCKLVDLVRREDSTDEEMRKQIDALHQAREKARPEWRKARRELAAALTTPRQEAVFLLIGYID